jgi:hypothetical protein
MATADTPFILSKKSHDALLQFEKQCLELQTRSWNIRTQMLNIDRAYQREIDFTVEQSRSKTANRYGDPNKFQNITVPVVMPMVEAAVTYQSSVFLTGTPLFGVVANPANIDAALQMETVIEDQSVRGGWVRELMLAFRDGFKYNLGVCEITWDRQVTAALETDLGFSTRQARPKEIIWEGNMLRRCDPYNTIFDTRVAPTRIHSDGEFAGHTRMMSRIQLKDFINKLPEKMNVTAAFESGLGSAGVSANAVDGGFYIPQINPDALIDRDPRISTNWLAWAGISGADRDRRINYKDMYEVTTLYARILPSDFKLIVPSSNTPQVWKFIVVNHSVIIYAERQTNAHNYLPMLFMQPLEDGLEYQTKSLATNVRPIQDITSAMWNSVIAARRRAISDRGIYDPSRIAEHHMNNENPAAKIPVRPSGYGKPVADAYYPIPFRDDQSGVLMQESAQILQFANVISGQNPVRQGQFVKGNKTRDEFQTVMSNANGRDQVTSMLLESQFFTPLKEIIKLNILQYQGGTSLFNRERQQQVQVDPVALRKAVIEFKISDGLTPSSKILNSEAFTVGLQTVATSPQIGAGYNVTQMFSYMMKTQGADLRPFEKSPEQLAYEQALAAWQQQSQIIAEALKKIDDPAKVQELLQQLPPQPTPEQFGYQPQQQGAAMPGSQPTEVATRVNNITNNITNQEQ